ncbi:MAG: hypothetical protein GY812_04560 [Actinomycetia bacterium]|nr:hypothetical protein [Actinomycetes bacterium]
MTPWRHRLLRGEVQQLFDGVLAADRIEAVLAHVAGCRDCRSDLRAWEGLRHSLRRPATWEVAPVASSERAD